MTLPRIQIRHWAYFLGGGLLLGGWCNAMAITTLYGASLEYRETVTRILEREDVQWSGVPQPTDLLFQFVAASDDASRVFFNVYCPYCPAEAGYVNRPFIADGDGANLADVSDIYPADLVNSSWSWGNMRINDDGSRAFIKTLVNAGYNNVYYRDNDSGQTQLACSNNLSTASFDWFDIDGSGDTVYLGKYDTGWSESLQHYMRGLYYADLGGAHQWYLDIYDLPCNQQCGNLNMLGFMGGASDASRTFFNWNSGQAGNICSGDDCLHNALWYADLDGATARVTNEEHWWVGGPDWRGIATADGEEVLYLHRNLPGDPQRLYRVDIPTGNQTLLTWTSDGNGYPDKFITPSGRYVFARGGNGDYGYHYHTLFDHTDGSTRDTWSYYLNWADFISNIAEDRYYFATQADTLYRIDTAPKTAGGYSSDAPMVEQVAFTDPALWDDDGGRIGVTVRINDPQGAETIDWVRLLVLVDGQEEPAFFMGREPLAFPYGDAGATWLYDDGTNGDTTAGDGWFSFDEIATRKGDYDGFNTWFTQFDLPHEVGVRILVKDLQGNYGIGDTTLLITDQACSADPLQVSDQTISGKRTICSGDSVELGPDLAIAAGGDVYVKAPSVVLQERTAIAAGAEVRIGQ